MFCSVLQCGREVTSRPPWGLLAAAHWRSPEWLLLPGSGGRCPAAAGGHLSPPGMANLHAPHGRPPGVASTFVPGAPHSVSDAGARLSAPPLCRHAPPGSLSPWKFLRPLSGARPGARHVLRGLPRRGEVSPSAPLCGVGAHGSSVTLRTTSLPVSPEQPGLPPTHTRVQVTGVSRLTAVFGVTGVMSRVTVVSRGDRHVRLTGVSGVTGVSW